MTDKSAAVGVGGGDRCRYMTVLDEVIGSAADPADESGNVSAAADGTVDLQISDRRTFDRKGR